MIDVYMCPLACGSTPVYTPRPGLVLEPLYARQGFYRLPSGKLGLRWRKRHHIAVPVPEGAEPGIPEQWALIKPHLLEEIHSQLAAFPEADNVVCAFEIGPFVVDGLTACVAYIHAIRAEDFPTLFDCSDVEDPAFTWTEDLRWTKDGPAGWKFTVERP